MGIEIFGEISPSTGFDPTMSIRANSATQRLIFNPIKYCVVNSFTVYSNSNSQLLFKKIIPSRYYTTTRLRNYAHVQLPTIYALSTHPGKAAIAVVRITGSSCKYIFQELTKRRKSPLPRSITYTALYDPLKPKSPKSVLDHAVVLYFQAPKSYTGDDILELQLHGGRAIVKTVLNAISSLHSPDEGYQIRYAEPGEFSKRAFQNGIIDLTQVEGIRDSIDAETETQRQSALTSASGRMKLKYDEWRHQIVDTMALLTALIDFSEDSDITSSTELFKSAKNKVSNLLLEIQDHYKEIKRSELLVSGIRLDFLGPPNAGKSFLLNRLAEREAAIVSDVPGTTRDVLELAMDISGFKVVLGDTAGLRSINANLSNESDENIGNLNNKIELEGMKRARLRFKDSDVVLAILPLSKDATSPVVSDDVLIEIKELQQLGKTIIVVLNKEDLVDSNTSIQQLKKSYALKLNLPLNNIVSISCLTQSGLSNLIEKLVVNFQEMTFDKSSGEAPIGVSQRTKDILENDVVAGLKRFLQVEDESDVVIATEELRFSADGIGKITGEGIGVEEILGVVFSSFCIGK